jgi:hypothetical protein
MNEEPRSEFPATALIDTHVKVLDVAGAGDVLLEAVKDLEEIAAAQEAQREAKREARKELQKARREKREEDAHAKVEELKSKLHRPKAGSAA